MHREDNNKKRRYFVTATGTDIGKTFITAALTRQARGRDLKVAAYKPVMSGFDPQNLAASDAGLLLQSLEREVSLPQVQAIAPWRYAATLAPSMAARMEGRALDCAAVVAFSQEVLRGPEEVVLIEGVGGLMVPLNERATVLDWMQPLGIPALLVVGSYLGAISHSLTALEVLRQRGVPLAAVIVNQSPEGMLLEATVEELQCWVGDIPVIPVRRRAEPQGWRDVPELAGLLP